MKANNNQTNAQKKLGKLPVWKLNDLYNSQNDKNLSADLNNIKKETKKFEKKYCLIPTQKPENLEYKTEKFIRNLI